MITKPQDLEWQEGVLPPVESVNYNCRILVWILDDIPVYGKLENICVVRPWENELNPLRWVGDYLMPLSGVVTYWAWIKRE